MTRRVMMLGGQRRSALPDDQDHYIDPLGGGWRTGDRQSGGGGALRTTWAERPAAEAAGRIWVQADGPYTAVDDGTAWHHRFYNTEVKPPTWLAEASWLNQGSRALGYNTGAGRIVTPTNHNNIGAILKPLTIPYDVRIAFTRLGELSNGSEHGLILKSSTGDRLLCFAYTSSGSVWQTWWNSSTSYYGNYHNIAYTTHPFGVPLFMRITNTGSGSRRYYISADNINWFQVHTNVWNEWLSEDRVGFYSLNNSNRQSEAWLVHWEEVG